MNFSLGGFKEFYVEFIFYEFLAIFGKDVSNLVQCIYYV